VSLKWNVALAVYNSFLYNSYNIRFYLVLAGELVESASPEKTEKKES
jgi:hypothetical protein